MASMQQGDGPQSSFTATTEVVATSSAASNSNNRIEEPDHSSSNWYFPREYIEKNSPSRIDGIDLKKETYFRKSYCTFLQDLGMRLKVPQITIATAIVFCHRFYLRQSHSKNDRYLIATTCMFLAGKVEETPQKLCDVIFISYEIRNKKDPNAIQRIKQKDVYEQQKELVLLGERLVLATLGFDLNIHHPYRPLVNAIKKFKVAQNALAQVAWNFVNDGLRTSLCLQFKPHHIAAGAIFLAAKFLKVKLPNEGEKVWWQEFDVTPRQLEEVSNQMLELYEQNREGPPSRVSDTSVSVGTSSHYKPSIEVPAGSAVHQPEDSMGDTNTRVNSTSHKRSATEAFHSSADRSKAENEGDSKPRNADVKVEPEMSQASTAFESGPEDESKPKVSNTENMKPSAESAEANPKASHHPVKEEVSTAETPDKKGDGPNLEDVRHASETKTTTAEDSAIKKTSQQKSEFVDLADVNIDRVKAAIQRRKMGREARPKRELTDEEELLEMELENGRKDVKQEKVHENANNKETSRKDVEHSDGSQEFQGKQHISKETENGEGKHHRGHSRHDQPQHHHNQHKFDSEMEHHQPGEKQERDYKKPRIDYRK